MLSVTVGDIAFAAIIPHLKRSLTNEDPVVNIPTLTEDVKSTTFATTTWAALCGLVTGAFAFGVSFLTIFQHLVQYNSPKLQKFIVRILMLVPIYAVLSILGLLAPALFLYFEVFRDIWEAAVIYFFGQLILVYCGGESSCVQMIQQNPGSIKHTLPVSLCLRKEIPLNPSFVKACKRGTLQFVIIKPVMGVASIVVFLCGAYESFWWRSVEGIVYNTSYSVALYALVLFYVATRQHPGLKGSNPVRKFVAVKIIVFATFWQSFFLQFYPGLSDRELRAWVNFILLLELPFFAILQAWAFPTREFSYGPSTPSPHDVQFPNTFDDKDLELDMTRTSDMWDISSAGGMGPPGEDEIELPEGLQRVSMATAHGASAPNNVAASELVDGVGSTNQRRSVVANSPTTGTDGAPASPPPSSDSYVKAAAVGISSSIVSVPRKLIPRQLKTHLASVADPDQRRKALDNVMEAVNMNDVVTDAYYNFNRKYQSHAMMENDDEHPVIGDGGEDTDSPRGGDNSGDEFDPFNSEAHEVSRGIDDAEDMGSTAHSYVSDKRSHHNLHFNTHLPGFTDLPLDVVETRSDSSFRQRRHSESHLSQTNASALKSDTEEKSREVSRSPKPTSTSRSVSSDDVTALTSARGGGGGGGGGGSGAGTRRQQHWWADNEAGWKNHPLPEALPPPAHPLRSRVIGAQQGRRSENSSSPTTRHGVVRRGKPSYEYQSSTVVKQRSNPLKRVIGRGNNVVGKKAHFVSLDVPDDDFNSSDDNNGNNNNYVAEGAVRHPS